MTDDNSGNVIARHIEPALRAALAELGGGMITGSLTIVSYIDADGANNWALACEPGQSIVSSLGLARMITLAVDEQATELFT